MTSIMSRITLAIIWFTTCWCCKWSSVGKGQTPLSYGIWDMHAANLWTDCLKFKNFCKSQNKVSSMRFMFSSWLENS